MADLLTEKQKAQLRWQAVEGFNSAPGLSPMARRVGVALICAMDSVSRESYISELRISVQLGVNLVSVKNAKAELGPPIERSGGKGKPRQLVGAGLIDWTNPGGERHLSHYTFNWTELVRISVEAKITGLKAMEERRLQRRRGSETATTSGSDTATTENDAGPCRSARAAPETPPKVAISNGSGSHLDCHGSEMATSVGATRLPDLTLRTTHKNLTHLNTPSLHDGADEGTALIKGEGKDGGKPPPPDQVEGKAALEKVKAEREARERKPFCPFPTLTHQFEKEPDVLARLHSLDSNQLFVASGYLASKGPDFARDYILGRGP